MSVILPQPPVQYDLRDQIETRRIIVNALLAVDQRAGQGTTSGVLGTLLVDGGSASTVFSATDSLDGGTA